MLNEIEREQNTHSKGGGVKIPLLPNNVGKRSGTDNRVTTLIIKYIFISALLPTNFLNIFSRIIQPQFLEKIYIAEQYM